MIQIEKQRRTEIKKIVLTALMHGLSPCALPIKIKKITRSFSNIKLIPYSKHLKRMNISYLEVVHLCESYDACTDYYPQKDMYYIYYNDIDNNIKTSNRYRWNIAHELGHVLLKHHIKYNKTRIFRSSLTNVEYKYLEEEADYFAQLILVPHPPLYIFKIRNYNNIQYLCQISRPASYKRFIAYQQWVRNIDSSDFYDKCIFYLYYDYLFKKNCVHCGATLIQEKGKYCPICGNKSLQWGDGTMQYPKIKAYDNGKLNTCPRCNNEETDIEGNYCQICRMYLVNECTNNHCSNYEQVLPTNARYCPLCGNDSLFFTNDILKTWNHKIPSWPITDGFVNIPDEDDLYTNLSNQVEDEGLPFN